MPTISPNPFLPYPERVRHQNPLLPVAYAEDIQGGRRIVSDLTDLYSLAGQPVKLQENVTIAFVIAENLDYKLVDATNAGNTNGWVPYLNPLIKAAPFAQRNQIQYGLTDNSNDYYVGDEILLGKFVNTDLDLAQAKTTFQSQQTIFNTWKRFSFGLTTDAAPGASTPSNVLPGYPAGTNSWSYNSGTTQISSTYNSGPDIGFVSFDKTDSYVHNATLTTTVVGDNDRIGLVIAFVEDENDQVPNSAYQSTSAFTWNIDTTSPTIPNQHALILYRNRDTPSRSYYVVYNPNRPDSYTVANGSSGLTYVPTSNWDMNEVDVQVVRSGDTITVRTTEMSDAPGGKGAMTHDITFTLNDNPKLAKFKGAASYGYACQSQAFASFKNVSINLSNNVIYDLRNGATYVADNTGVYTQDTGRTFFGEIGTRRELYNPETKKLLWVRPDKTVDLLNDGGIFLKYPNSITGISFSDARIPVNKLTGFDAYLSADMPTLSDQAFQGAGLGGRYFDGIMVKTDINTGFQMAVNWDGESSGVNGVFFRNKDDTQPDWGAWREVIFKDYADVKYASSSATGLTLDQVLHNGNTSSVGATIGDLTVQNLFVAGTATTINSQSLQVKDSIIMVNRDEVGAGVTNRYAGLEIDRGTLPNFEFLYDETINRLVAGNTGSTYNTLAYLSDIGNYVPITGGTMTGQLNTTNLLVTNGVVSTYLSPSGLKVIRGMDGSNNYTQFDTNGVTYDNGAGLWHLYIPTGVTGTFALVGDIPDVTGYVPYSGATHGVSLNSQTLQTGLLNVIKNLDPGTVSFSPWTNAYPSGETLIGQNRSGSQAETNIISFAGNDAPTSIGGFDFRLVSTAGTETSLLTINGGTHIAQFVSDVYSTGFYQTSQRKLKTDIKSYDENALDLINKLQVNTFYFKNNLDEQQIGFIVDEVENNNDAILNTAKTAINKDNLIAQLTKAVQELSIKVEKLENA